MSAALKTLGYLATFAPIYLFLTLARLVPFRTRSSVGGALMGIAARVMPRAQARIGTNLALIYPDMPKAQRDKLVVRNAATMGRTLTEVLFNEDQITDHVPYSVSGPGLEAIRAAAAEGKGAILVSGHFGQWDAARIYLKSEGLEVGAIYRPNNNPYYEPYHLRGITAAGAPIFSRGRDGTKEMLRHLRQGGRVAILADQHLHAGTVLPFMGYPAMTTLSPARMALRFKAPLVPVWGIRDDAKGCVNIVFEAPIAEGTPEDMMTTFNTLLAQRIHDHPEQWLWAHRRWKPVDVQSSAGNPEQVGA